MRRFICEIRIIAYIYFYQNLCTNHNFSEYLFIQLTICYNLSDLPGYLFLKCLVFVHQHAVCR